MGNKSVVSRVGIPAGPGGGWRFVSGFLTSLTGCVGSFITGYKRQAETLGPGFLGSNLILPLSNCENLGKLLHVFVPQFSHL